MTNKIGEERIVITITPELKRALVAVGVERGTSMSEAARHIWEVSPEVKAKMEEKDE